MKDILVHVDGSGRSRDRMRIALDLALRQGGAPQVAGCPPVDLLDHLSAWGIAAQGEHLPNEHIGKMDMLLSRAFDLGADLLVMWAHGHGGFSLLHGSATQHLLRHMTLPVLMTH